MNIELFKTDFLSRKKGLLRSWLPRQQTVKCLLIFQLTKAGQEKPIINLNTP